MRCYSLIVGLVFALTCSKTRGSSDKLGEENKRKIEKVALILRETIKEDLITLYTKHNKAVDKTIAVVMKTVDYVDKNIEELKTHIETRIEEFDNNTMNKLIEFKNNTASMMAMLNETLMLNLESMNNQTMDERNDIISWAHERAHLHENIMKTRITVCAYDYGHYGEGVVSYNSNDGGYIEQSGSIRIFNNTDLKEEDVLNRDTGIFKVPINASGEYVFTFTVTIDSFDQKLTPSAYYFRRNGELIEGTKIYADIGFSKVHDRVPGSRTIILKLEENDEVSVTQEYETDIQDYQISFCGALLHLEKVF